METDKHTSIDDEDCDFYFLEDEIPVGENYKKSREIRMLEVPELLKAIDIL